MKSIKTQIICNQKKNDDAGRDANRKAEYINKRVVLISQKVSERKYQVVFDHEFANLYRAGIQRKCQSPIYLIFNQ
jgi:hypothetical protein